MSANIFRPGRRKEAFDPISTILTGLQEELGLKVESKKVLLDLLIIEHAERCRWRIRFYLLRFARALLGTLATMCTNGSTTSAMS